MIEKIRDYIQKQNMITPGETIWAAVSGGADSVALLLILEELSRSMNFTLKALHVEHGIRGEESLEDAEFVADLCKRLEVPLTSHSVDVPAYAEKYGLGEEEAARILRYRAFHEVAGSPLPEFGTPEPDQTGPVREGGKIAIAHHGDDQAETVLFMLARGTGLDGLCGMAPVRRERELTYIRPLLCVDREEIENYLREKGQDYRTDSTNQNTLYARNRLRREIIPQLAYVNGAATEHICQTADRLRKIKDFVDDQAKQAYEECLVGQVILKTGKLKNLHPALVPEVFRIAIQNTVATRKDITSAHLDAIAGLLDNQSGRQISLPYGIIVKREGELLHFLREQEADPETEGQPEEVYFSRPQLYDLKQSGETFGSPQYPDLSLRILPYDPEGCQIPKNAYTFWLDYDRLKDGFFLRHRKDGDWFFLNTLWDTKRVNRYFIDEKIPESERDRIPVLAIEDHVFWVDRRVCAKAHVGPETKWILEIKKKEVI